jgi:hypothetical protein
MFRAHAIRMTGLHVCIPQSRASSKVVGMRPHRDGRNTSATRAWPTYVHRSSFQALAWIPRSMLAANTTFTVLQLVRGVKPHARHPIVHLFTC